MGIWIFMMVINLIIPLIFIGFGTLFVKKAPQGINMTFGYRSAMSMKNKETWEFAHYHCGKIWRIMGWSLLPISFIAMIFCFGKEVDIVVRFGTIVLGIQLIFLIGSTFPTEVALRKHFDKNGLKRK